MVQIGWHRRLIAIANSIEISYETFGRPDNPCLVLVMGLGEQMGSRPTEFRRLLADSGSHVIRFDKRDSGLSTKFDDCCLPDLITVWGYYFQF